MNGTATIGRSTPANTNITYPKITIADFDIPHSQVPAQDSLGTAHNASWCDKSKAAHPASTEPRADANLNDGTPTGQIGIEVVTGRRDGHPIPHLMLPHLPASDAPGNVFVAPLTLSGTTL